MQCNITAIKMGESYKMMGLVSIISYR